jgi:hypothetical protein
MTAETENHVLEILRRMQGDLACLREEMHLLRLELTSMRHDPAGLRTMQDVHTTEVQRFKARLMRIQTRLVLRDA